MAGEAQRRAKEWLDQARKAQAAPQPSVAPHAVRPRVRRGDTLAELEIPRLRLSVAVFEGDDEGVLRIGAGHIPGTALPVGRFCKRSSDDFQRAGRRILLYES